MSRCEAKRLSKATVQQAGAQSYARFLSRIKERIRAAQVVVLRRAGIADLLKLQPLQYRA